MPGFLFLGERAFGSKCNALAEAVDIVAFFGAAVKLNLVHNSSYQHQADTTFSLGTNDFIKIGLLVFAEIEACTFIPDFKSYSCSLLNSDDQFYAFVGITVMGMNHQVSTNLINCQNQLVRFHFRKIVMRKNIGYKISDAL